MRLVFAGTPEPAVPALTALLSSRHEVAAVLTRPSKPAGRGRRVTATPVADLAYPTTHLDPHENVVDAIGQMRADRSQLALVVDPDGEVIGITALEDLLERVLGEFEDETDRPRR